jgi:hypothetical protein
MCLLVSGVKLNGDGSVNPVSTNRFSLPSNAGDGNGKSGFFKSTFTGLHGTDNFISGAYIKIPVFLQRLTDFENDNCNRLQISFWFMSPVPDPGRTVPNNLNCFHLIFHGMKSNDALSAKIFSTYDNEPGYSGPKPSTPPFGGR